MRLLCWVVLCGLLVSSHAGAAERNFDLRLRLLEMKPAVADAMEKRLAEGGEAAAQVMKKLPDLMSAGRIRRLEDISVKGTSEKRQKLGESVFNNASGKAVPGKYSMEMDPVVGLEGQLDVTMHFIRSEEAAGGAVALYEMNGAVFLPPGNPTVVGRVDQGGNTRLMLLEPDTGVAVQPDAKSWMIRLEAELFKMKSERAASAAVESAKADPGASGKIVANLRRDGASVMRIVQRRRGGMGSQSRIQELQKRELDPRGMTLGFDNFAGWGLVDIGLMNCEYIPLAGKIANIEFAGGAELKAGKWLLSQGMNRIGGGAEPWVLAVTATSEDSAPALKEPLVAEVKPGASGLVTATYPVRPGTLRRLREKFGRPAPAGAGAVRRSSTRELFESAGVKVAAGGNMIFNINSCSLVVRLEPEAHTKLVEVVNSLVE